jgi:hypothetical protein
MQTRQTRYSTFWPLQSERGMNEPFRIDTYSLCQHNVMDAPVELFNRTKRVKG